MKTNTQSTAALFERTFPFKPTESQSRLFGFLAEFVEDEFSSRPTFILQGYAGTGKTSVIGTALSVFKTKGYKTLMMAPTGRASKVMSFYSGKSAYTIHKIIFKAEEGKKGLPRFMRQKNNYKKTIFIVDEASMIGNEREYDKNGLLDELISFVFEDPTSENKLLFVGDTAQLPPVGMVKSPALSLSVLRDSYNCTVRGFQLREVVRQTQKSGILYNATLLREKLMAEQTHFALRVKGFSDVFCIDSTELGEQLSLSQSSVGLDNTVVLCRTNKETLKVNGYIRRNLLQREADLDAGDMVMVVKNNYFWLPKESPAGFLANGEFAEVLKVLKTEEKYGFRFADLRLQLTDYPNLEPFQAKVILNTLYEPYPSLNHEQTQALLAAIKTEEDMPYSEAVLSPYAQALQIKFSYALTCHKAQGGQWKNIFILMGYLSEDMINEELLRWLYTALTRAQNKVYLVNFRPEFLE
jgi:exodeoxyribonuclease-5